MGDVLLFVGTMGASSTIKTAASTANTAGLKAAMSSLKAALRSSAQKLAQEAAKSGFVRRQLSKCNTGLRDRILENGAVMLLAANLPGDWGTVAWEIAAAVDPTGVVSVVRGFVPSGCDEMVFMSENAPPETDGEDLDALDERRSHWAESSKKGAGCCSSTACGTGEGGSFATFQECEERCKTDPECMAFEFGNRWSNGYNRCISQGKCQCWIAKECSCSFEHPGYNIFYAPEYMTPEMGCCSDSACGVGTMLGHKTFEECKRQCNDEPTCSDGYDRCSGQNQCACSIASSCVGTFTHPGYNIFHVRDEDE